MHWQLHHQQLHTSQTRTTAREHNIICGCVAGHEALFTINSNLPCRNSCLNLHPDPALPDQASTATATARPLHLLPAAASCRPSAASTSVTAAAAAVPTTAAAAAPVSAAAAERLPHTARATQLALLRRHSGSCPLPTAAAATQLPLNRQDCCTLPVAWRTLSKTTSHFSSRSSGAQALLCVCGCAALLLVAGVVRGHVAGPTTRQQQQQ